MKFKLRSLTLGQFAYSLSCLGIIAVGVSQDNTFIIWIGVIAYSFQVAYMIAGDVREILRGKSKDSPE